MAHFLELVDRVCGEAAHDGDDGKTERSEVKRLQERLDDNNEIIQAYAARIDQLETEAKQKLGDVAGEDDDGDEEESSQVRKLQGRLKQQGVLLDERQMSIDKLENRLKQRDADSEDAEETRSKLETVRKLLREEKAALARQVAVNKEYKEELAMYRRDPKKYPLASRKNSDDDDDDTAEETGKRGADDAEDDVPTVDHADDHALSVADAKVTKKPGSHASTKKPRPPMPPVTPAPKATRSNSTATDQSKTSKKPERTNRMEGGSGTFGNGFERQYGPSWGINDNDPEKTFRDNLRKSRQLEAKGTSDQQTPEGAAAGTSAADKNTDTPSGQTAARGPGRKPKNDQASEADVDSDQEFEEPRKSKAERKRKSESSDEEEQPKTSKKPKIAKKLQLVEEESDDEDKHVRAVKGSRASSASKAKSSHTKQNVKRKAAQTDTVESEGGMSGPIFISSAEDTDSDTDDED